MIRLKPDNNDDFIKSLQPDAVRLQSRSVTEDGVKIPLNFQFVEQIRRKNPERLFEPIDVNRPRERIVTVEEFDNELKRAEKQRDGMNTVFKELKQKREDTAETGRVINKMAVNEELLQTRAQQEPPFKRGPGRPANSPRTKYLKEASKKELKRATRDERQKYSRVYNAN